MNSATTYRQNVIIRSAQHDIVTLPNSRHPAKQCASAVSPASIHSPTIHTKSTTNTVHSHVRKRIQKGVFCMQISSKPRVPGMFACIRAAIRSTNILP
jgi:hypothetical protein